MTTQSKLRTVLRRLHVLVGGTFGKLHLRVPYKKWRQVADENERLKRQLTLANLKNKGNERYADLIMAVETKFPGESRFQTALRYIQEREKSGSDKAEANTANVTGEPSRKKA